MNIRDKILDKIYERLTRAKGKIDGVDGTGLPVRIRSILDDFEHAVNAKAEDCPIVSYGYGETHAQVLDYVQDVPTLTNEQIDVFTIEFRTKVFTEYVYDLYPNPDDSDLGPILPQSRINEISESRDPFYITLMDIESALNSLFEQMVFEMKAFPAFSEAYKDKHGNVQQPAQHVRDVLLREERGSDQTRFRKDEFMFTFISFIISTQLPSPF